MPIDQIYLDEHNILILKEYISQPAQKMSYGETKRHLSSVSPPNFNIIGNAAYYTSTTI